VNRVSAALSCIACDEFKAQEKQIKGKSLPKVLYCRD